MLTAVLSALTFAGVWISVPTWTPASASSAAAASTTTVFYAGCSEARAAGATTIERGQPGYRAEINGDGDGIACEPPTGGSSSRSHARRRHRWRGGADRQAR